MTKIHKRSDYTVEGPDMGQPMDMDELKRLAEICGSHYFERSTMRFFRSRIGTTCYTRPDGWYFTTSEQFVGSRAPHPRRYSLRKAHYITEPNGDVTFAIDTVGEFQAYASARQAVAAIPPKR